MPKAEALMSMTINGHQFDAWQREGEWSFTCSLPEVAADWDRARGIWDAVERFTRLALAVSAKEKVKRARA